MNKPSDHRPPARPRRAQPLQPDAPGRGTEAEDAAQPPPAEPDAARQKEQSETALDNVREGYGR